MLNKKYAIDNFYIGQLYSFNDISNGAIRIDSFFQNERQCMGFLTLFFKKNNGYLCLHDGVFYSAYDYNYLENLVSLSSVLPKIDFNIASLISFGDAIWLFDALFKKENNDVFNMYSRILFDINDFLVGPLNLYCGYGKNYGKYNYYNLIRDRLLLKNKANLLMFSESISKEEGDEIIHDYATFECLFLKLSGDSLYNLNDYQIYDGVLLGLFDDKISYNYYDKMVTFSNFMKNKGIDYDKNEITIPKALKIYKRLK